MMNALPILTDGPSLVGRGGMSDSQGPSGELGLSIGSNGFKEVMAKVNAVSKVATPSKQSDIGPVNTAQMPDERQLQQVVALVQQLPQDVQQMLVQAVNQGDLQQLQWILQRIQISKALFNGMVNEAAPVVNMQSADANDVRTGPMDVLEAQELALAIWLMSFVRPLTQGAGSEVVQGFELHTESHVASVNGRQLLVQDKSVGSNALVGIGPDSAIQPSIMASGIVSGDSSVETSGVTVGQSTAPLMESSSSLSSSQDLFFSGLLNKYRAAGLSGDSKDLRLVLERMMQASVGAGITAETKVFADSFDLPVTKGIVDAANAVAVNDNNAILQSEPMAVPIAGANQEKSAQRATKQAVFADSKESLKNLSQGFKEHKSAQSSQSEPLSSLQTRAVGEEILLPFDQDLKDMPLNDIPSLQQITGDSRMEFRETLVIRRNVSAHAVTREMENIITKGMEQGQTLPRRVVLYLDPPELGRVRVNMTLDSGNQLSVNFMAEHASVRTVLEGHMEQLRDQLVQKGMEVSNLRVESSGFADFTSPNQGFEQNTHQERWESFKEDWYGMIAAKNMAEDETSQTASIQSNTKGRLHLII